MKATPCYLIGLDTETCNSHTMDDGGIDLTDSLVYDIGWVVTNPKGEIFEKRSFVVWEIYCGYNTLMKSAYYAEKLPQYEEDIKKGIRKVAKFETILKAFREDCRKYNAEAVFAHNARFDVMALNNTIRLLTLSKERFFFPYYIEIWDTLKMCKVITQQKKYIKFCQKNGYMTKHKTPRPQATAEVLFRYIKKDTSFEEEHTALADVLIETEILAHCFRQHKKMVKTLLK